MNDRAVPYPMVTGRGVLARAQTHIGAIDAVHRIGIVTDNVVGPLHLATLRAGLGRDAEVITIESGEQSKTRETWAQITDTLQTAGFGRDSLLIALGGGVIGDLTGFVAATYQRGIPFVQAPTTLLAMVDAAIGGKTGVDTPLGKNLVGAFHEPLAVLSDLDTLGTLPGIERRNGLAEAIKHGVIADAAYFASVSDLLPWPSDTAGLESLVRGSVAIKTQVVARDLREQGLRKTLNFGHTIGHAIEHLLGYAEPHGACVAIGMVVEAHIAAGLGIADTALVAQLGDAVRRAGLPDRVPPALSADAILSATATDKKARAGVVEYTLPTAIGTMSGAERGFGTPVPADVVRAAISATR
jgi:3-dehydroquinate synthase